MRKFDLLDGVVAPMYRDDVDTDAIIPLARMKAMDADLGAGLFANLRYRADGSEDPEFVLNRPPLRRATIIVAGDNFGCGSSREQAVWALEQFGIRSIVAAGFGDIFYDNCIRKGILPVVLPKPICREIALAAERAPGARLRVDLRACTVTAPDAATHHFVVDAVQRQMLLEGLDAIAVTMLRADQIAAFQSRDRGERPWIYVTDEPDAGDGDGDGGGGGGGGGGGVGGGVPGEAARGEAAPGAGASGPRIERRS